ncbi:MAG: hypothetical protein M3N19_07630 [Candidatus Eremiobacteraeota bacterium]|nr:hypothetical protein [Candidatus Eremiobacteraeota bacterium]
MPSLANISDTDMTAQIDNSGQPPIHATALSQSLVFGAQLPAGGPQPPPTTVQAAIADSHLQTDSFTLSKAASILLSSVAAPASVAAAQPSPAGSTPGNAAVSASAAAPATQASQAQNPATAVVAQDTTSNTNVLEQFEQDQGPPPYTLHSAEPNPNRENARQLQPASFSPFQIRQFSDLLRTLRSVTSAVLPNFSFSA